MLARNFKERVENEVLVTDITYLPTKMVFYLSAVQDLYNNEIVAWKISERNDLELVMDTLQELTAKERCTEASSIRIRASNTHRLSIIRP